MDIRVVPKLAMHNKKALAKVNECVCYYCSKVFSPGEITEWVDNNDTAMCPHCGIDSVIPVYEESDKDADFLAKLHKYWF
jgi:predicted  nucleic acid-binding Zn-ribbon protein